MSILNSLAQQLTQSATVVAVVRVATHTLRLTLGGPALRTWTYVPGQTLNVFFGLAARGGAASLRKRTYSVWGYDPMQGHLELAICTFSGGPGARWAEQCQPGDTVHFAGPGGKFVVEPAPAYVLLGDISCLAHFYALRRRIPAHVPVVSVIHAHQASDCFADLDGSQPLHVVVANTLTAAQYLAEAPLQALLAREPQALVYWGGPQATCVAGHRLLQLQYRWPNGQLKTKPFWK
ncbi:siderophore-interacting protein [Hymenobacter negativus]|uniref:Siderophore-interacting protein n=1 Tax=Hymenobacter negativus TaxID=2795026 RepID=A0ABS3QLP8_9BACT|nr:siderophore-interacting protein [Hymenobacter negativus]MBO2012181.1 siderophore-interacting protein [Hymenobacter negativus]